MAAGRYCMNYDMYIEDHEQVRLLNDVINNVYFSDKYCI